LTESEVALFEVPLFAEMPTELLLDGVAVCVANNTKIAVPFPLGMEIDGVVLAAATVHAAEPNR